jgi:hypothetical protein
MWVRLPLEGQNKNRPITCVSGSVGVRFEVINQTKKPPRVDKDMMSIIPQDDNIGKSSLSVFLYFFLPILDTFIKRTIFIRNYNNTTNANFKHITYDSGN